MTIRVNEKPSLSMTFRSEMDPGITSGAISPPEERERRNWTMYPWKNNVNRIIRIREDITNTTENGFKPFTIKEYPPNTIPIFGIIIVIISKVKNNTALRLFVTYFIDSRSMNRI